MSGAVAERTDAADNRDREGPAAARLAAPFKKERRETTEADRGARGDFTVANP